MSSYADAFLTRSFTRRGPKVLSGFSRPIYHNFMGLLHGHQFNKRDYGGMLRRTEAAMLYRWAMCLPRNAVVVEIGCYGGLSTLYLASGLRNRGGVVYSIDPFDTDLDKQRELTDQCVPVDEHKPSQKQVQERLRKHGVDNIVHLIAGYSQEVAKSWDDSIDFLWIDGNHEQAWQDYSDFKPFLKQGARVAVHDAHPRYGYESVVRDARYIFNDGEWDDFEHVKSILSARKIR